MEFFINKGATLPVLKMQVVKDGIADITEFMSIIENSLIYFSMIDVKTGAYKIFIDSSPEEKAKKCAFVLHTQVVDEHGTDLEAVRELLFGEDEKYNIIFSPHMLPSDKMNLLYNSTDCRA